jgi:hypothetical protein
VTVHLLPAGPRARRPVPGCRYRDSLPGRRAHPAGLRGLGAYLARAGAAPGRGRDAAPPDRPPARSWPRWSWSSPSPCCTGLPFLVIVAGGRVAAAAWPLAGAAAALLRAGLAGHGVGGPVRLPGPLGGQRLRRPAGHRGVPGAPLRADALVPADPVRRGHPRLPAAASRSRSRS